MHGARPERGVTTVIASRDEKTAVVKYVHGHTAGVRVMLELKDTAQGSGEMIMFTVLVNGNPGATDALYVELVGHRPERHGLGRPAADGD